MYKLVCPICKQPLERKTDRYICINNHSFDVARQGYVNLLLANQKHSKNPGDNAQMLSARRALMQEGYYSSIVNCLKTKLSSYISGDMLDLGCGEGIISNVLADYGNTVGVDISKYAVRLAASSYKKVTFVLASVNALPFSDNSFNMIINCFAPLKAEEVHRILKPKGYLIKITPMPKHLMELKSELYADTYENNESVLKLSGFDLIESISLEDSIKLSGINLLTLIQMTPYFYKTSKQAIEKITSRTLDITLAYCLNVYQKN